MLEASSEMLASWRDEFPILHRSIYMKARAFGDTPSSRVA